MSHTCPRRAESHLSRQFPTPDEYDAETGGCSYCGSISPEAFFAAIEAGYKLGPTDKSYKVYVDVPNPNAGKPGCFMSCSHETEGFFLLTEEKAREIVWETALRKNDYIGRWVKLSPHPEFLHKKFYFQHLDGDGQQRFVDLLNAKKMNLDYPGYFYVRPFFIARPVAASPPQTTES